MSMDTPAWNQGAELPPPKKSGSKTWLILGVVLGICVLICCGGGVALMTYIGTQAAGLASVDPVEVNKAQAEIVTMDVPAEIPPKFKLNLAMFGQQLALLVYYGAPGDDNLVWLAGSGNTLQQQGQGNPDAIRAQLETQLVAQGQNAQAGTFKTLSETTQRDVEVTVNGETSKIALEEGADSAGKKYVQASGMFQGKTGPALIKIQVDAEKFSAEQVEAMLKSMK